MKRSKPKMLKCGHPGEPQNLIDGHCGTCIRATEWQDLAKLEKDPKIKALFLKMAAFFQRGQIVHDTRGKSLLEWEREFSRRRD